MTPLEAAKLEGLKCRHPLYDRPSLVVLAPYVTLDQGTGCVHTAPGHGREDYETGLAYGLEPYSPVDDDGRFTKDVGFFAGKFVFDANADVNAKLTEVGALLYQEDIDHQYPHCWRCKQPVIFRSTPQWFISMENTGLRQKEPDRHRPGSLDSQVGSGPHLPDDRKPAGLVHFPAAGLGRAHHGLLLP